MSAITDAYNLTNSLIGQTLDPTVWNALARVAQMNRELAREWMTLKKKDASQTVGVNDTFLTSKTIPADFLKFVEEGPIQVLDSLTSPKIVTYYTQVPMERQNDFKDDNAAFYADYAAMLLYLCGVPNPQTLKIQQFYIYKPANVTYDSAANHAGNVEWAFPSTFTPVLGYDVAAMYQLGIDYDDLNSRMGNNNAKVAEIIFASMVRWDSRLARNSVRDMPLLGGSGGFQSRKINIG